MRHKQAFEAILRSYAVVAAIVAFIGVSLVVDGVLLAGGLASVFTSFAPWTGVLAGMALVAAAMVGYRLLGKRVRRASEATRAILASAHRDALTGVLSRSFFFQLLRSEVYPGSVRMAGYMQLDMDNLKVLNDTHGHGSGDAALVSLTRTISELLPQAIVGRLGGDEFGIVVLDCDSKLALQQLGEELLRRLDRPQVIAGRPVRLSATIGLSLAPFDAVEVDELVSKADLALYKGKRAGRRMVVPFDTDMLGDERHRRFVERELRAALLMDELKVFYQPVFDGKGDIRSHEALVRWRHKVRGTIAPNQFIGVAEESDLIDRLGEWVLRRACLDLPRLGKGSVAVNVSPAQLRQPDFAQRFSAILSETGTDPHDIIIEITETVPLQAGRVEMGHIDALRKLGVRIAIDDFGAGYASLQYLRGFSFDIIKIDRSYVANIAASRIDAMIVGAICDIARSMQVAVVAEGIETQEQLERLRAVGCEGFQGFLLGRPLPLAAGRIASAA